MKKILFILLCLVHDRASGHLASREIWTLPVAVTRESVLDELTWQGLRVRAETLQIPVPLETFTAELANLIPEQSLFTKEQGGLHFQWVHENVSYLLMIESHTHFSTGILSSVSLTQNPPTRQPSLLCTAQWLPNSLHPLFSMRDSVRAGLHTSVDGYVSDQPVDLIRQLIVHSLKRSGWMIAAQPSVVDRRQSNFSIDANCGLSRMSVEIQKEAMQTQILVMRMEQ